MSLDRPSDTSIDASGLRIGIVAARFNGPLVGTLLERAAAELSASGAPEAVVERVPGSAELPAAAALMSTNGQFDAILALGVVVAGATKHHDVIAVSTADAFQRIAADTGIPVINGVIVTETSAQAEERTAGAIDRGREFARAALEMAAFKQQWTAKNKS